MLFASQIFAEYHSAQPKPYSPPSKASERQLKQARLPWRTSSHKLRHDFQYALVYFYVGHKIEASKLQDKPGASSTLRQLPQHMTQQLVRGSDHPLLWRAPPSQHDWFCPQLRQCWWCHTKARDPGAVHTRAHGQRGNGEPGAVMMMANHEFKMVDMMIYDGLNNLYWTMIHC